MCARMHPYLSDSLFYTPGADARCESAIGWVHAQLRPTLFDPWTVAHKPLSMGFLRQGYWRGLPFPPPGDLPDPGIEPKTLSLLHCQAGSLPRVPPNQLHFSLKEM